MKIDRPATNLRTWGTGPFGLGVVHGGPGGAGEIAPVARQLSESRGVLEPLQTATSVGGQVDELANVLKAYGRVPLTLVGHSWGAWLSLLVAARHPTLVRKLILVSSGVFDAALVPLMQAGRQNRLSAEERIEYEGLESELSSGSATISDESFRRFAELSDKADSVEALDLTEPESETGLGGQPAVFEAVWPEAAEMRSNGKLMKLVRAVACPVVAIHGDSDPSPANGVEEPLRAALPDFRMIILDRCGHTPWREKHAQGEFFQILERELK